MTTRAGRSEVVEAEGHLVDSQLLTLIFDKVIERGGRFDVLEFKLGRTNEDFSHLKLKVTASDDETLRHLLEDLIPLGCHSTPQGGRGADTCRIGRRGARWFLLDDEPPNPGPIRRSVAGGRRPADGRGDRH